MMFTWSTGSRRAMRTTLSIDDDLLNAAKALAQARSVSIGAVISDLVRKGLSGPPPAKTRNGLPVFITPLESRPITLENVKKAEDVP
jgi:hypothetical protein